MAGKNKKKKKRNPCNLSPEQKEVLRCVKKYVKKFATSDDVKVSDISEEYGNAMLNVLQGRYPTLNEQYYRTYANMGFPGETKDEVLSGNIISLPKDYKLLAPEDMRDWSLMENFLHAVPCFVNGTIESDGKNDVSYTRWTTSQVNLDKMTIDVTLFSYSSSKHKDGSDWIPNFRIRCLMMFTKEGIQVEFKPNDCMSMSEIVTKVPYSRMNWSPLDVEIWKNTAIQVARTQEENWDTLYGRNFYEDAAGDFIMRTMVINAMLEKNRPSTQRQYRKKEPDTPKPTAEFDPDVQSKRRTRTVGPIAIKSVSVPRMPTQKTITRYSVASWACRGHMRHYKSGKTVYIQPTVRHRHALKKEGQEPAPVTINIKE